MPTMWIVLLVSMAWNSGLVNAVNSENPTHVKRANARAKGGTLPAFIDHVIHHGKNHYIRKSFARLLELEALAPTRAEEEFREVCADDRYRSINVIVSKSPETGELKPVKVMLYAKRVRGTTQESAFLRLGLDGKLEKSVTGVGQFTPEGKPIRGSAKDTFLDPASPEAQALLKRELDFWLKGVGLKQKPAPPPPVEASAQIGAPAAAKTEPSKP